MAEQDTVALIVAAGKGARMGANHNKLLLPLGTRTILEIGLETFLEHPRIRKIYLTVSSKDHQIIKKKIPEEIVLVEGGARRQDSVHNALLEIMKDKQVPELVLVHDGARPFCSKNLIDRIIDATLKHSSAIPVLPLEDTIRRIIQGKMEVLDRRELFATQTPQGFRTELIMNASKQAIEKKWFVTDDASLVGNTGNQVAVVEGEPQNIKITTPADLERAIYILNSMISS